MPEPAFFHLEQDGEIGGQFEKLKTPGNILIISSIFHPHVFGGAEIAAYNKAKLLVKRGLDVSVVTLQEKDMPPAWGETTPDGFRLYRIKAPRRYTLLERTRKASCSVKMMWHLQDYFDSRNQWLLGAVLDHVKPDHIEIDNLVGIGFNVLSEVARRDVPVSYILHDLNLACFNTGMIRNNKPCKNQCVSCKGIANLRQSHLDKVRRLGFISPSRANLERAKKYIPMVNKSLSCVIRNVPEEVPPLERKRSERMRLLYVGRLDPVKGIDVLLEALDGLNQSFDFILTVMGTGPSEQRLREKYGDRSWVEFRGFVPRDDIAAALLESDLYCMPSVVVESYGLVTAQALQLGTPVIGSNAGGTAELVRDGVTGCLVTPGDARAWQDALRKIFSNPKLLNEWQMNAVSHAHEFDADAIGQTYEEFITRLTARTALRA